MWGGAFCLIFFSFCKRTDRSLCLSHIWRLLQNLAANNEGFDMKIDRVSICGVSSQNRAEIILYKMMLSIDCSPGKSLTYRILNLFIDDRRRCWGKEINQDHWKQMKGHITLMKNHFFFLHFNHLTYDEWMSSAATVYIHFYKDHWSCFLIELWYFNSSHHKNWKRISWLKYVIYLVGGIIFIWFYKTQKLKIGEK